MSKPLTFAVWVRRMALYAAVVVAALVVLPWIGPVRVTPGNVLAEWRRPAEPQVAWAVLCHQRLPRVLLGLCVGAALGMAGAGFQVLLRNPLATPYTLGIASAGALAAATSLALAGALASAGGAVPATYLWAMIGSAVAAAGMFGVARRVRRLSPHVLLLTGVAVNMFCGAALLLVRFVADPLHLVAVDRWLMGGLVTIGYVGVAGVAPFLAVGGMMVLLQAHALNQFAFGEDLARSRGVHVQRVILMTFSGCVIMVAGAVAVAGPIGFVGLLVPHAVRLLSGADQRVVLPASALLGAALLAACDAAARACLAPTELPVGIITACAGAPVFLVLLLRYQRPRDA